MEKAFVYGNPVILPQGDGSVVVRPGKPVSRLTPLQFARTLGVSRSSVYRYVDEGILPDDFIEAAGLRKIVIKAEAVEWFRQYCAEHRG